MNGTRKFFATTGLIAAALATIASPAGAWGSNPYETNGTGLTTRAFDTSEDPSNPPPLAGATVVVYDAATGAPISSGVTDDSGVWNTHVPLSGRLVIVATPPAGYERINDSDGGLAPSFPAPDCQTLACVSVVIDNGVMRNDDQATGSPVKTSADFFMAKEEVDENHAIGRIGEAWRPRDAVRVGGAPAGQTRSPGALVEVAVLDVETDKGVPGAVVTGWASAHPAYAPVYLIPESGIAGPFPLPGHGTYDYMSVLPTGWEPVGPASQTVTVEKDGSVHAVFFARKVAQDNTGVIGAPGAEGTPQDKVVEGAGATETTPTATTSTATPPAPAPPKNDPPRTEEDERQLQDWYENGCGHAADEKRTADEEDEATVEEWRNRGCGTSQVGRRDQGQLTTPTAPKPVVDDKPAEIPQAPEGPKETDLGVEMPGFDDVRPEDTPELDQQPEVTPDGDAGDDDQQTEDGPVTPAPAADPQEEEPSEALQEYRDARDYQDLTDEQMWGQPREPNDEELSYILRERLI